LVSLKNNIISDYIFDLQKEALNLEMDNINLNFGFIGRSEEIETFDILKTNLFEKYYRNEAKGS
jgi:hypothetical protein